jgi:hypothetical protein
LLIGSVEVDAKFGRKYHGSIPYNYDREEVGTTMSDLQTILN